MPTAFVGCKLALIHDGHILTYLRDDKPGLPWPAMWDLPGGGRDGDETPEACVLRELHEEFGLLLPATRLEWHHTWPSMTDPTRPSHFFAGRITPAEIAAIVFGNEGQTWLTMPLARFLSDPQVIPEMQRRTQAALSRP